MNTVAAEIRRSLMQIFERLAKWFHVDVRVVVLVYALVAVVALLGLICSVLT